MRTRTAAVTTALLAAPLLTACGNIDDKPDETSAAVMCEDFVKDRLKSPGSADFPGVWDEDYAKTTTLHSTKPWKFQVAGVVDSQNTFGAKVRSTYVCTISTKDNKTWQLDDMAIADR
ncbi:hypothetical protein ACIP9H_29410 [Streptomyces sp. NPDC088732]|uniref:hypothetical protein n=1 Tax=Streptomyces sp. NPDC088732 TaxID=3365879 RepID=UPI003800C2AA